jgi:hypothetical protein
VGSGVSRSARSRPKRGSLGMEASVLEGRGCSESRTVAAERVVAERRTLLIVFIIVGVGTNV